MSHLKSLLRFFLLSTPLISGVWAEEVMTSTQEIEIPYFDQKISIDGRMNEKIWQQARKIELNIETSPANNKPAPVKTTAYLFENGTHLYIAFDAKDPNPQNIRAFYRDRDKIFADDNVGINIDPSNKRNLAFEFFSNALGVQLDLTEDDLNKKESSSWDGIWDSAGQINEHGFIVEMAIPFRLLKIKKNKGPKKWAFELLRFYQRDFTHRISNNIKDRNIRCHLCQLKVLKGFENVDTGNDLQLIPSLVISKERSRDIEVPSQPWLSKTKFEPGFDVRWGINSNLTLNTTFNPDFSQIEADASQVSINQRFALFFPEKRAFFLESADFFNSQTRLLYTRLISDPDWGIKLTQENGNNNWALFSTNDKATTIMLPGPDSSELVSMDVQSTNNAFRFNHHFSNDFNLGTLITNREGKDFSSTMSSIDGRWDISETQQLSTQLMHSNSQYPDFFVAENEIVDAMGNPKSQFADNAYKLSYEFRSSDWVALLKHTNYGKDFRADLGFVTRADFIQNKVFTAHKWYGNESDFWNKFEINAEWKEAKKESGELLEREKLIRLDLDASLQSTVIISGSNKTQKYDNKIFKLNQGRIFFKMKPSSYFQTELFAKFGDQIDFTNSQKGKIISLAPKLNISMGKHWLLSIKHDYQKLDVTGGELFHINLTDLKLNWQKDTRTSIRLTAQFQNIIRDPSLYLDVVDKQSRDLNMQLLYSYKIDPQTLIFAGINTGRATPEGTRTLKEFEQLVFMKFSYSWLG